WAEQRLASGIAALLSATSPLWLTTLDWPASGRPGATTIAGLALGIAGVAALVAAGSPAGVNVPAALVLVAGTLPWAAGPRYSRPPRLPASVALGAGMPLVAGGLLLLLAALPSRGAAP